MKYYEEYEFEAHKSSEHNAITAWELEEQKENDSKWEFYSKRATTSILGLAEQIKEKISFYSQICIYDHIEMMTIKMKKIKYQLRHTGGEQEELKHQVTELKEKLDLQTTNSHEIM